MIGTDFFDNNIFNDVSWKAVQGKNIFITGGTGFVGTWLLESFAYANEKLGLNAEATVLTRNLETFWKKAPHLTERKDIKFLVGDVRNFSFPDDKFDFVIHAATESSSRLNEEDPQEMLDVIINGTRHTLNFAKKCGAKKFLFVSSGAVYGRQPADITHIHEDYMGAPDVTKPPSAYGEGKRIGELLCTIYSHNYDIECMIARCFAFVGPYLPLNAHFAIGNFIRDGLKGGPIIVKGDGTPYRSYMYAADLAVWLWTILFKGKSCRPYNVGSEEAISIKDLAYLVASCFDKPIEVKILGTPDPSKPPERYVPSTARARSEIGVKEITNLSDAIKKTIYFYENKNKL